MSRHIHACDKCSHKLPRHPFERGPIIVTEAMLESGVEYLTGIPPIGQGFEPHQIKAIAENLFSLMVQKLG
jgi:hypothetical protein